MAVSNWDIFVGETVVGRGFRPGAKWTIMRVVEDDRGSTGDGCFNIHWWIGQESVSTQLTVDAFPAEIESELARLSKSCERFLEDSENKTKAIVDFTDASDTTFNWSINSERDETVFEFWRGSEGGQLVTTFLGADLGRRLAKDLQYVCRWGIPPGGASPTCLTTEKWSELQENGEVTIPRGELDNIPPWRRQSRLPPERSGAGIRPRDISRRRNCGQTSDGAGPGQLTTTSSNMSTALIFCRNVTETGFSSFQTLKHLPGVRCLSLISKSETRTLRSTMVSLGISSLFLSSCSCRSSRGRAAHPSNISSVGKISRTV